jgi:uncharacterized protein (TIGR02271 family)
MNQQSRNGSDAISSDTLDHVVPLLQEEVRVDKREVLTGKVRIQTVAEAFEEKAEAVLQGERVEVTRIPVDRVVSEAPAVRTEGGVTIVPVLEEILFVEKRLVLKEELHIRRTATTETVELPVTLRKQRAVIERVEPGAEFEPNEEIT